MFLTSLGTLASCPRQEETRDKRVPVAAAGSGPLAGKLAPEYPEWLGCQSQRKRVPARVTICCRKADPFQGPKLGSCLTLGYELSEETHVLTKQEILLGKGTRVESSRVRKPRRTALPRGSHCPVLWWFWEVDGHAVSPLTIHFGVLDKSPVSGPGRGPSSCNKWRLWWDSSSPRLTS